MRKAILFATLAIVGLTLAPGAARAGSCFCDLVNPTEGQIVDSGRKCEPNRTECKSLEQGSFSLYANCVFYTDNECKILPSASDYGTTKIEEDLKVSPPPKLQIKIPGVDFSKIGRGDAYEDELGNIILPIPWLGEYIGAVYNFAVAIASILAVIMIIVAGARIVVSGGGENKVAGYKTVERAVIGLLIVWGSYAVLYTINPDLVSLKALKVRYVAPVDMPVDLLTSADADSSGSTAPPPSLADFSDFHGINNLQGYEKKYALKEVVAALSQAVKEYDETVVLNSAWRSPEEQYRLMQKYCGCPNEGALPNDVSPSQWPQYCSGTAGCQASWKSVGRKDGKFTGTTKGHMAGNAVDVSAPGASNIPCSQTSEPEILESIGIVYTKSLGPKRCIPKEQQLLIRAMLNAGFCVGLKNGSSLRESWHFEYTRGGKPVSAFCTSNLSDPNMSKLYYLTHDKSRAELLAESQK